MVSEEENVEEENLNKKGAKYGKYVEENGTYVRES